MIKTVLQIFKKEQAGGGAGVIKVKKFFPHFNDEIFKVQVVHVAASLLLIYKATRIIHILTNPNIVAVEY